MRSLALPSKKLATIAGLALLAVPLAACSQESDAAPASSSQSQSAPKPVASIDALTGGNVTVFKPGEVSPYVIGQLQHENSGLSLTAGTTTVELTNLNVDPGVSRVYGDVSVNGKTAVTSAYLFSLDGRTLKPLAAQGDTAVLEGTK